MPTPIRRLPVIRVLLVAGATLAAAVAGCASYATPGRAADFAALGITRAEQAALTDGGIAARLDRRPAAGFPAAIALARVQAGDYSSYSYGTTAHMGSAVLISRREVPGEDQMYAELATMPMVRGVAPLNSLVLGGKIAGEKDLRLAAANVQADMLLLYTFDTQFLAEDNVPFIGIISLGILPDRAKRVRSTCAAVLVDTRTGYVYGLAEGTAQRSQIASAWSSTSAAESARLGAEGDALRQMADQFRTAWGRIAGQYGPAGTPARVGAGSTFGQPMSGRAP